MGTSIWASFVGSWFTASNWIGGVIPSPSDDVVVLSGEPIIDNVVVVDGLTLSTGNLQIANLLILGPAGLTCEQQDIVYLAASGLALNFGVTLNNVPQVGPVTINNESGPDTLSGTITGSGSLEITGQPVTLSGNNNYSGGTIVNAGVLIAGSNNAVGSGAVTLEGNSTLELSTQTLQNAIVIDGADTLDDTAAENGGFLDGNITIGSGSGNLTIAGAGSLALEGQVQAGALTIGNGATLVLIPENGAQNFAGGVTVDSGGILGVETDFDPTVTKTINLEGGSTLLISNRWGLFGNSGELSPQIVLNGDATINLSGRGVYLGSTIAGSGTLTITNGGNLSLDAAAPNNYGSTVVDDGATLSLGDGNTYAGHIYVNDGTIDDAYAGVYTNLISVLGDVTFEVNSIPAVLGVNAIDQIGNITGIGGNIIVSGTDGTLILGGVNSYNETFIDGDNSGDNTTLSISAANNIGTGSVNFTNTATLELTAAFTLKNPIALAASGQSTLEVTKRFATLSGLISGGASLAITGGGGAIFSGANTYTGGTSVQAGTLKAGNANAFGTNTVTVSSGATLDFNGFSVGNAVTNSGTVTDSTGVVQFNGAVTNNGILSTTGGNLTLAKAVTGTGSAIVSAAGHLTFAGAFNQNVAFQGAGLLNLSQSCSGVISGFGADDTIDLQYLAYHSGASSISVAAGSAANTYNVTFHEGSASYTQTFGQLAPVTAGEFKLSQDANGGTNVTFSTPPKDAAPYDFNGDRLSDILFRNTASGETYLWEMNGTNVINGAPTGAQVGSAWQIEGVGDFNGDGDVDLLWEYNNTANAADPLNGISYISMQNGAATAATGSGVVEQLSTNWQVAGVGDFTGSGISDILFRYQNAANASDPLNGETFIDMMNGSQINWTASGFTSQQVTDPRWSIVGVADFTGSGHADVLWQYDNASNAADPLNGTLYEWQMNGTSVTSAGLLSAQPGSGNWKVEGTGDFDGNGTADVLLRYEDAANSADPLNGLTYIDFMNGANVTNGAPTSWQIDNSWQVAGIGDYNGDGKADILFQQSSSGQTYIWEMNGANVANGGLTNEQTGLGWTTQNGVHISG